MNNPLSENFLQQYIMMTDWVNIFVNSLSDEEFKMELSQGKNHGVWILGHLITSDDDFSLMMGRGDLLFPQYQELFGQGSKLLRVNDYQDVSELKANWNEVIEKNKKIYKDLKDNEFEQQPENTSEANKDYFKTKAKVIMAWQLHQMYHGGQLSVLAARAGKKMF